MRRVFKGFVYLFFPLLKDYHRFTKSITNRVSFNDYLRFRLSLFCDHDCRVYWPVHKNSEITHPNNIIVGVNSNAGTRPGCYLQGNGGIYIGDYVHFASNIGIISGNHGMYNHMEHDTKEVVIDDYCWIGMNSVILPGVHLGKRTIVGAGSVVTKSFPEGFCVIGGNPAKVIKELDKTRFIPTKFEEEYYGFIPKDEFVGFAQKHLKNNRYINEDGTLKALLK